MLVRFLRDFASKHTGETFYEAGAKAEFTDADARALIDEGACEAVPIVAREKQAAPAPSVNPPTVKRETPRLGVKRETGRGRR